MSEWLAVRGLEQYAAKFRDAHIEPDFVDELTDEDLRELGVSLGHRRKLLSGAAQKAKAALAAARQLPEAERRQVTVLFSDLVDSTGLATRIDPEDLMDVLSAYHQRVRTIIEQGGGSVTHLMGDGIVAFFGYPVTSVNDAERAVSAGLDIVREVTAISTPDQGNLNARVGIATGLVVVGDLKGSEIDGIGRIPNLAARIQSVAEPGCVAISDETRALAGHAFECTEIGHLQLKGFQEKERTWSARARKPSESRFLSIYGGSMTGLTGRQSEISRLKDIWSSAGLGSGAVVVVQGQPGIGKSRLCYELSQGNANGGNVVTLQGIDGGQTEPFAPLIAEIERSLNFVQTDTDDARLQKLENHCLELGLSDLDVSLLATLCAIPVAGRYPPLEMSPARLRTSTVSTLANRVVAMASKGPLLLLAEDAHWYDPTTIEFLATLIPMLSRHPICLVITEWPRTSGMPVPWADAEHLDLTRLSREDARALLAELAPGLTDTRQIENVLDRTDCVPLFLREIALSISGGGGEDAPIPATLQGALLARLDRLGLGRRLAQVASVIGREFDVDLLQTLSGDPPDTVDAILERLVAERVIEAVDANAASASRRFRFTHALIQQAAYESQLRKRRRVSHLKVAEVLSADTDCAPRILAHHFDAAGQPGDAMLHWRTAGLQALMKSHNAEAMALYDRAATAFGAVDAQDRDQQFEVNVLIEQGMANIATLGFAAPQVQTIYERAVAIGRELGPGLDMMRALWGALVYDLVAGNLERARANAEEMLVVSDALGDGMRVEALLGLSIAEFWMADLDLAEAHMAEALELYDVLGSAEFETHLLLFGQDPKIICLCYLAFLKWVRGELVESRECTVAALRLADKLGHPFTSGWAYCFGTNAFWWRGEYKGASVTGLPAMAFCEEHVFPLWGSATQLGYGAAMAHLVDSDQERAEVAALATVGLESYMMTGARTVVPMACLQVADTWMLAGDLGKARYWIEQALQIAKETGELISEMRVALYLARLLQAEQAPDSESEDILRQAMQRATERGAWMIALEDAQELSRLLAGNGRGAEAFSILSDALNGVPEPHRHANLRAAHILLNQISPGAQATDQ